MQTVANQELPKRSRYYHGMLDLNQIEKGMPYRQLKTCYVIFICKDDLGELPRYTYRMRCEEELDRYLEDGTYTVFLNAYGDAPDLTEGMREFLAYIREGSVPEDPANFVSRLHQSVAEAREHKEWRLEYMTLQMRDEQMREEGREEGRAALMQAKRETAYELYAEDGFSPEKIAKRIKASVEQVKQWLDERAVVTR